MRKSRSPLERKLADAKLSNRALAARRAHVVRQIREYLRKLENIA